MSTAYSSAKQKYIGNGVTTEWGFDFPIKKHSELKVYLKRSSLPQVLLEEGVDYSFVTENTIAFPIKTGEAKLQATDVLALQRESVFESEYNFSNQQRLEPEEVMHSDDNLERQIQELKRDSESAIKVQPTSNIDTDEYFVAVESIYENLDNINNVSGISAEIVTCSNNIEAIKDAPNQANAASQSASDASQSASDAAQSATNAANSATDSANSASASANSAQQAAISAAGTHFKLFQHQWFDYELNDLAWLRADTFSWQSGTVYSNAYNHLVDDINGITPATETVGGQTVTFYRASDGHKIVLSDQETTVNNIYTATGVAWYYILDTVNNRFKLPRTKYDFDGLRGNVGDYIPESLPNITGFEDMWGIGTGTDNPSGSYKKRATGTNADVTRGGGQFKTYLHEFDASGSSSTYQNNAPVQQRGTQQYLYFYVGQYTQSAIEQTAGLNAELFNNKIDIDGNNVITAGANKILNTSSYTTNRILEIPQDIKLELNNGTLTLKAGSKLYYPDGFKSDGTTPKFFEYIVPTDYSFTGGNYGFTGIHILAFGKNSSGLHSHVEPEVVLCYSGTTAPTNFGQYAYWWDLSTNQFKWTTDSGSTWNLFDTCLPVALFHYNGENISGIDQVFNGLGYIGSTVFALPGVKVQTPNGKNTDGTYKSVIRTIDSVRTYNTGAWGTRNLNISFSGGVDSILFETLPTDWFTYNKKFSSDTATVSYDGNTGIWWYSPDQSSWSQISVNIVGSVTVTSGKITSFEPYTVDSVANSNASNFSQAGRSYLSGLGMPSNRYIDLTLGASGSTYTAPANGTFSLWRKSTISDPQLLGVITNVSKNYGSYLTLPINAGDGYVNLSIEKGDIVKVQYSGTFEGFRFIYAEGEK